MPNGYRNCHVQGLDSIVISRYPDGRPFTRIFFTRPEHVLHKNFPGSEAYSLGFHTHKSDLILTRLKGEVFQVECRPFNEDNGDWNHYKFRTQVIGEVKPVLIGKAYVSVHSFYQFDSIKMRAADFHSIYVPEGQEAAWLVTEGELTKSYNDSMYTNSVVELGTDLYQPMSDSECQETLLRLLK